MQPGRGGGGGLQPGGLQPARGVAAKGGCSQGGLQPGGVAAGGEGGEGVEGLRNQLRYPKYTAQVNSKRVGRWGSWFPLSLKLPEVDPRFEIGLLCV